jgi:hypothetical protein
MGRSALAMSVNPTFDGLVFDLQAFDGIVGPVVYPEQPIGAKSRLILVRASVPQLQVAQASVGVLVNVRASM